MLVTFKTSAHADITMFGSAAVSLLKMMGQSGNVPGAIMAEDIPAALDKLKTKLAEQAETDTVVPAHEPTSGPGAGVSNAGAGHLKMDDDEVRHVPMSARATPLIGLLEAARDANENVLWDE